MTVIQLGDKLPRMIQSCSAWERCPYEDYAVVDPNIENEIFRTGGYCDITLSGGVVTAFTQREIPQEEPAQVETLEQKVARLERQLTEAQIAICEVYEAAGGALL